MSEAITVIGCGALGGYYGGLLAQHGLPVAMLTRTLAEADLIATQGLSVTSPGGDFVVQPVAVSADPAVLPTASTVLVTLKTTNNHQLGAILPACAAPDACVVAIQNGLDVERVIAEALPAATVLGCLAFVCAHKLGPGRIQHIDYGPLRIGQWDAAGEATGVTAAVERVVGWFQAAGVHASAMPDLIAARWHKLVWNIPFNGLATLLERDTQQVLADVHGRQLVETLMHEVVAGAAACGRTIAPEFVTKMMTDTERMVPYQPSMQLDFQAGRPLELDAIYWAPVHAAAAAGQAMPATEQLAHLLAVRAAARSAVSDAGPATA